MPRKKIDTEVGMYTNQAQMTIDGSKPQVKVESFDQSTEFSQKKLVLMWGLILLGYFLFVVQWYAITNFAGGYNTNIGVVNGNAALAAMPNWTITLMRGIGSILAGWLLAKIGHRYAVITVLSLMICSFPFLVVAGLHWDIDKSIGYNPTAFGLFIFFRMFLAIGGTTLITYTNSIIAKMPNDKKPTYMTINQFGFNGGAFFANIFFCFAIANFVNANEWIWLTILVVLLALVLVILILYLFVGREMVPPVRKTSDTKLKTDDITFGKVFKQSYTWKMSTIFIVWLVSVVFINSPTMRTVIEQSPANLVTLATWNVEHGKTGTSSANAIVTTLGNTSLTNSLSVVVGSGYNWVWPTFICMFVAGFFVGLLLISPYSKTLYKRKKFIHLMFFLGFVFAAASILVGYYGGYGNPVALAFFFILIFISGAFLWAIQPVLLSLYQQAPQSTPKYTGIIAGLIWGIGYTGYTIVELSLSLIQSYTGTGAGLYPIGDNQITINGIIYYATNTTSFFSQNVIYATLTGANALPTSGMPNMINDPLIYSNVHQNIVNYISTDVYQGAASYASNVSGGDIAVFTVFFVICLLIFIPIQMLPNAGIRDKDGNFKEFDLDWKPWQWNFKKPEVMIH